MLQLRAYGILANVMQAILRVQKMLSLVVVALDFGELVQLLVKAVEVQVVVLVEDMG